MGANFEHIYSAAVALLGKGGAAASLLLVFMGKCNFGPLSSYRGLFCELQCIFQEQEGTENLLKLPHTRVHCPEGRMLTLKSSQLSHQPRLLNTLLSAAYSPMTSTKHISTLTLLEKC